MHPPRARQGAPTAPSPSTRCTHRGVEAPPAVRLADAFILTVELPLVKPGIFAIS